MHSLDVLRGLAVALMVVDHVALALDAQLVHSTVGRAAFPLFFIVGGHLAHGVSRRLGLVLAVGLGLQLVAPWTGALPLLALYVAGALLVGLPAPRGLLVGVAAVGLTLGANGYADTVGSSYDPACALGLMALGALARTADLDQLGGVVPRPLRRPLRAVGRRPLTWYAGHVLVLVAVVELAS